jgi:hypothetical protein
VQPFIIVLLLAACASPASQPDSPAVAVIKEFILAIEARDPAQMLALLEPTDWRRQMGTELRLYTASIEHIEFHDETYEVLESSAEHAEVYLHATLDYRIRGAEEYEREIDIVVEVVQQDGEWYVRDFALPGPVMAQPEE